MCSVQIILKILEIVESFSGLKMIKPQSSKKKFFYDVTCDRYRNPRLKKFLPILLQKVD